MTHKKNIHSMQSFALKTMVGSVLLAIYAGQVQAATGSCATNPVASNQTTTCTPANNDTIGINAGISITTTDAYAIDANGTSGVTINNDGSLLLDPATSGFAAVINGSQASNLTINNSSTGIIDGNNTGNSGPGVYSGDSGAAATLTIDNAFVIEGTRGIEFYGDVSRISTNTLDIINRSGATISGAAGEAIDVVYATVNSLSNAGTISASSSTEPTIDLLNTVLTSFDNSGTITATASQAFELTGGPSTLGTFVNSGSITNQGFNQTVLFLHSNNDASITNSGTIQNSGSGEALSYTVGYQATPNGTITNTATGEIRSNGPTAVFIGGGSNLSNFTNEGTIFGDFVAGSSNAIETFTISGNQGDIEGNVDLVSSTGTAGLQGGSVVFTNSGELSMYQDQFFKVNQFNLSGGTLILDPTSGNRSGGSSATVSVPTIIGNLNGSGGTVSVVMQGDTSYGQLEVDGAVDLNNTTMNIVVRGGPYTDGNVFQDVISTTGTINYGTFTITDDSTLYDFDTVRNASDLDLQLTTGVGESSGTTNTGGSNTGNLVTAVTNTGATTAQGIAPIMQGLANDFANGGTGNAQLDQVVGLSGLGQYSTEQQLANAVESLAPASTGAGQQATFGASQVMNVIAERSDFTRGLSGRGMNGGDSFSNKQFWIQPFGSWTEQDNQDGVAGYKVDSQGLVLGVDGQLSPSAELGVAFSVANSDVTSKQAIGGYATDVSSYQVSLYGTKSFSDTLVMNGNVSLGTSEYDTNRTLFDNSRAKSSYGSTHSHVNAELEKHYAVNDKLNFAASVNVDYHNVNVDSYSETGAGALNLNVDNQNYDSLVTSIGGELTYAASDKWITFGSVSVGHDFLTDKNTVTSSLTGTGATFTTEGIQPDERVYNAGLGAKYSADSGTEFTAKYNVNARDNYVDQTVSANLRILF